MEKRQSWQLLMTDMSVRRKVLKTLKNGLIFLKNGMSSKRIHYKGITENPTNRAILTIAMI